MKILFTTPVLEHPPAGGSQLRIENSIKALSRVCEMDIISRSPPSVTGGEAAEAFYKRYCKEFHVSPATQTLSNNKYLRKAQRIFAKITGRGIDFEARYILEHVRKRDIRIIWFGYGNISFSLIRHIKKLRPDIKIVCDTDSVWSRFILRELPYAKGFRKLLLQYMGHKKQAEERAWVNLCDITTAVSEVDANYYRSLASDASRIRIFSNVIDLKTYETPPPPAGNFQRPSMYVAGVFGRYHSPMDMATRWVLNEVWPLVKEQIPNVHFYIVGKESDRMFGHITDPQITVTGKLESVLPYLCHVNVALVPLKYESGTRYKILEAGACKIPLVSTTLGAEGIDVKDGQHLLLADDPQDFANAIVRLMRDENLAKALANNCHNLVCKDYSVESLMIEARGILESL